MMSGIIFCACSTSAISVLQFALKCHGKANSTRIRRRTSHSKIKTYDEFDSEDANSRVVFDFIKPGEEKFGSQEPWSSIAEEDRSGRPDKGTDLFEASDHHYREQFMESFSSASYSKWDDDRAWSSQEWKTEIKTYNRSGRPDKTSWRMVRKVRPGHEEILLDGTAQSVRNEETLRDRSGRLMTSILKKRQDLNNWPLETMKQNWNCL